MAVKTESVGPGGEQRVEWSDMSTHQFKVVYKLVWGSGEYSFAHRPGEETWIMVENATEGQINAIDELLI